MLLGDEREEGRLVDDGNLSLDVGECSGSARRIVDQRHLTEDATRSDVLEDLPERDDVDAAAADDVHRRAGVLLEEDAFARIEAPHGNASARKHAEVEIGVHHGRQCLERPIWRRR